MAEGIATDSVEVAKVFAAMELAKASTNQRLSESSEVRARNLAANFKVIYQSVVEAVGTDT